MRERPILFNGAMVRAILEGRKTQTRRVVKLPHQNPLGEWQATTVGGPHGGTDARGNVQPEQAAIWHTRTGETLCCPIAEPGDVLWVRETWADLTATHGQRQEWFNPETRLYERSVKPFIWYRADGEQPGVDVEPGGERWRPSIHMPRWASRLRLAVNGVRVERLQDTSDVDVTAEGAIPGNGATARGAFVTLWDSAYGAGAWDANPWVWVVEFERV